MNIFDSIFKFFINISKLINKLLENNLNKLNSTNLLKIVKSNKIFIVSVAIIVLFLSYLSIPNIYNKADVIKELKKELTTKFNLNLNFSKKLDYKFFPRPHFETEETSIFYDKNEISKIKKLKIYISIKNLFSLNNINVNNIIFDGASFNLNKDNYNFFINLLNNNFLNTSLQLINSNIFYRNTDGEVLFMNKISEMKYYYDDKEFKNFLYSENELFNIPYSIEIFNDKDQKKIHTKLNINLLRLLLENQHSYQNETKSGVANLVLNNMKSIVNYKKNKNSFEFNYFDKKNNQTFLYNGELFFKPFYSNLKGYTEELNLFYLLNSKNIIPQLLKTKILNNKNLNIKLNINAKKILNYNNFVNILFNSKIQEGLIDVDNTEFGWKNYAKFKLFDSLIYIKDGELILDANTQINIYNYNEIYKFLQSPRNYRKKIKKIELNFNYNFDQKVINVNEIRIDNKSNQKVGEILKKISIKNDDLQNKIYFKNLLNNALKNYSG
tara:strand:+ start:10039 stop:11529 length:1491 start_codon:yes stop_codon:yes gene_type:complete